MYYAQLDPAILGSMSHENDYLYGIPISEIARICEVDLSTARRWKRGAIRPPRSAEMLLAGDLGAFDRAWKGWKLKAGLLVSPEGWEATPGHVRAMKMMNATLAAYRSENQGLKNALSQMEADRDAFEDQPAPDAWTIAIK